MNFDVCFLTDLVRDIKRNSFIIRNPAAMNQCMYYVLQRIFSVQGRPSAFILWFENV